tara:strand:+ start:175 stop:501 length:327 start_codon:yes stop_codon:yes gene_type:complete
MFKSKLIFSILIFTFLLIGTSLIKNQTREIEKKIYSLSKIIHNQEKNLSELQLDFAYLSSPSIIEMKIENLDHIRYLPIENSKIFLSIQKFTDLQNKFVIKKNYEKKK